MKSNLAAGCHSWCGHPREQVAVFPERRSIECVGREVDDVVKSSEKGAKQTFKPVSNVLATSNRVGTVGMAALGSSNLDTHDCDFPRRSANSVCFIPPCHVLANRLDLRGQSRTDLLLDECMAVLLATAKISGAGCLFKLVFPDSGSIGEDDLAVSICDLQHSPRQFPFSMTP